MDQIFSLFGRDIYNRVARLEALLAATLLALNGDQSDAEQLLRDFIKGNQQNIDWDMFTETDSKPKNERGKYRGFIANLYQTGDVNEDVTDDIQYLKYRINENEGQLKRLAPTSEDQRYLLDVVRKSISTIERQQETLSHELHEFLITKSLGVNPDEAKLHRFLPIRVYLPTQDRVKEVSASLETFLRQNGFTFSDDFPPQISSWFKKWFVRTEKPITQPELMEVLAKIEYGVELHAIKRAQAEVDEKQAKGAAELLKAMGDQGIVQIGSILIVKFLDANNKPISVVRNLTTDEMLFLEEHPQLLMKPTGILDALFQCHAATNEAIHETMQEEASTKEDKPRPKRLIKFD